MSLTKTVGFFAGTTLAIGGAAFGADQTNYASEIAELKAQIAEMKSAQGESWLTEQRAAEIRGIVTDVLADAETRSSLQGSGAGAGYDGGFFLSSADGNYSMKINVLEQIRWAYADNDDVEAWGFENKRTRLTFSGNMVDSSWSYKIAYYLGYANSAEAGITSGSLADAYVEKDFGNGFAMTVGQFKIPFSYEYGIDAGNLQFMDYSVVNSAFGTGYGQGLQFGYSADMFRLMAAYVNGENEVNADWGPGEPKSDFTGAARVEFKAAGNWDQFNDGMSFRGEEFGALIGAGFMYASNESDGAGGAADVFKFTLDGTVDFGGGNIAAAFYWADVDGVDTNPWGLTVGGGFFVTDEIELVARWESFDDDAGTDINTLTIGGNWYLAKNTAKFQADFGYAFDALALPGGLIANNNWVPTAEDGEWVIRGQLSFSF